MRRKKSIGWHLTDIKDWIVPYLIVLIIPIIICSVFFLYTYLTIWEEIKESNTTALQIVASELEDIFTRTFAVEYAVQRNDDVQEAADIELPLDANDRLILTHAANAVRNSLGDTIINDLNVYLPGNDMLVGYGAYYTMESIYERIGQACGYTYEEWHDLLNQRNHRKFLAYNSQDAICYITTIPMYGNTVRMNVIIYLNYTEIRSILDMIQSGGILLADGDNRVLMNYNLDGIDVEKLSGELEKNAGYQILSIENEKVMASCVSLKGADLKVVSVIPYEEFWDTALESLTIFYVALAFCILTGIAVSVGFSLLKHKTWGKLNTIATNRSAAGKRYTISRNREIAEAIDGIVTEYNSMKNQLDSVYDMKRELLVVSALKGRIRAEEVEQAFDKNKIEFQVGNYEVMLFKLNGFERFFDAEESQGSNEDIRLIRQTVTAIMEELNFRKYSCEILDMDEKIVCIVDFGALEKEACYQEITQFARESRKLVFDRLGEMLTISISDVHRHVCSLQNAYNEALRTMEYQVRLGDELVMNYIEMLSQTSMSYLYSIEEEKILINLICEGKEKAALQLFEEICEKNIISMSGSEEMERCLMWALTASVFRAENELRDRVELPGMSELLDGMKAKNSVQETKRLLTGRIKEICKEITKIRGKKDMLAEQVMVYIQEHYMDVNLSNSEIADYFHINSTYLSTFFKENTGMNLLAYIHKVRLDKAKQLLETTGLTLEEIGEKVGCNNKVSFIRLLKKYEGITPTEYRKKSR